MNKDVVAIFIVYLSSRYGKEAPLTVTRGNVHRFLGMSIDYSIDGKVQTNISH